MKERIFAKSLEEVRHILSELKRELSRIYGPWLKRLVLYRVVCPRRG